MPSCHQTLKTPVVSVLAPVRDLFLLLFRSVFANSAQGVARGHLQKRGLWSVAAACCLPEPVNLNQDSFARRSLSSEAGLR